MDKGADGISRVLFAAAFSFLILSGCLYFGSGNPQQSGEKTYYGNNNCLFEEQGFDCGSTRAYTENGKTYLDVRLVNRYGMPLSISRAACVYGSTDDAYAHSYPVDAILFEGQDYENQGFLCVDSSGNPVPAYPEFRGKLLVWFNYLHDSDLSVQHVASATMISS